MAAQVLPVDGLRLVKMLELCFMKLQLELEPETKILHISTSMFRTMNAKQ